MSVVQRVYRLLLRLYPAPLRDDYERELTLLFQEQLEMERTLAGRCACAIRAAASIVFTAPGEHLSMITTDLRYTLRTFLRSPWFTFVALVTLALGIGVNSALFSVVKSVLLEALPYRKPAQLVRVWVKNPPQGIDHDITSFPRFQDWKQRSRTFQDFSCFTAARLVLTGVAQPQELKGAVVLPNFLRVMGVTPVLGRDFQDADAEQGRPPTVLISHRLWRNALGADPNILGRHLQMSGLTVTVVGVAPDSLQFPDHDLDFWTPLVMDPRRAQARGNFWLDTIGRLRDGVTMAQAQSEMDSIARALDQEYLVDHGLGIALVGLQDDLTGPIRPPLLILSGAVVLVLLICCANIAGMLTARAADRERELSIRSALGAGRRRVVRQLLTEAVALFLCGGALGIGVAAAALRLLLRLAPPELPQLQDTHLDLQVIAFTFAVSAISGLIFGLRPALRASRLDMVDALKQGGRNLAGRMGGRRFRAALTIGEMALAVVLLTGAGLLVRSFQRIQEVQLGFDPQHVFLAQVQLAGTRYPQGAQATQFYDRALSTLRSTPGIESAAGIRSLLLSRLPNSNIFAIEGRDARIMTPLTYDAITPEFFSTMKIPLLRGRFFNAGDGPDAPPVAIVNASTAKRYWPGFPNGEDPIGKRYTTEDPGPQARWLTIVGIVADTRRAGVDQPVFTESYQPLAQSPALRMQIVVRTSLPAGALKAAVESALHGLDRDVPVASLVPVETALGERVASRRFTMLLLSLFAATALLIAGVGIYGLISYLASQRRQEFGVRLALGAQPADVLRLVAGRVMAMAGAGLALGVAGALVLTRALQTLLFEVTRFDPQSYALAGVGLLLVCLAAAVSPAIRALRMDPLETLRAE